MFLHDTLAALERTGGNDLEVLHDCREFWKSHPGNPTVAIEKLSAFDSLTDNSMPRPYTFC